MKLLRNRGIKITHRDKYLIIKKLLLFTLMIYILSIILFYSKDIFHIIYTKSIHLPNFNITYFMIYIVTSTLFTM